MSAIKYKIDLSSLNEGQKLAVTTTEGPVLVIAGPGSGKTSTLVERIIYLMAEKNVTPENIMVSTFTEKASKELITRVTNKVPSLNINEMYIGTLHSIFLRILEENREFTRLKRNYRLLDQFDQQYLIYQNMPEFDALENIDALLEDEKSRWKKANIIMNWLNKVGEESVDETKLRESKDSSLIALAETQELYNTLLKKENTLDFSTIQSETFELLNNHPPVLKTLQNKIEYIMVDEYQDTNTIQELILLKLASKNKNICVVGDDDQGLYRFRGATIRNILEFPDNFNKNECKKIYLSINYRSHPKIIDFFNNFMNSQDWELDGKQFRFQKDIIPNEKKTFIERPSVIKVSGQTEKDHWHDEVYHFLLELKNSKKITDYNQVAFLFKSVRNDKVTALANFLETKGINVFSPRSKLFFDREEIKLLIGAIIFLFPQFKDLRENIKGPVREYYEECLRSFAQALKQKENIDLLKWAKTKALDHENITKNADYAFSGLLYELLQFPLFSQHIHIDLNQSSTDLRPAYNLALFSKLLNKYEYLHNIILFKPKSIHWDLMGLFNQFLRFLIAGGIDEYEDFDEITPSGSVSFMTIHQSKGLEFPIVFVGSLNTVPTKQYTDLDIVLQNNYYRKKPFEPIEKTKFYDFWRLYYVAFSRAQNLLVLTGQENATGRGRARLPSKYFKDFYNPLISWKDKAFQFNDLNLDEIKSPNIKSPYSFTSHILLYENCALQYKFFKELEFIPVRKAPIIFGVLVHQTIEDIHKVVLRGELDKVTTENIENWYNENYNSITKRQRVYLNDYAKGLALEHVLNYYERQNGNWDKIKEAEVDVSLVKEDYILNGTIDLIEGENQTVEIVDFKSEKKLDVNSSKDKEKLERYQRQLEVYAHIVEERTGHKVSQLHLYYTGEKEGNPRITFPKSKLSINETVSQFDEVVNKIEAKDYHMDKRPESKICKDCDMNFYCDQHLEC